MKSSKLPKVVLYFCLFVALCHKSHAQCHDTLRVAFWNLENFFDTFVDSTRKYNEFTASGSNRWTPSRFYKKRNNIYKTLLHLSQGKALALLGVAEVENEYVLNRIFYDTPLKRFNYRYVLYESEDSRGIDVALAYCMDKLQLVYSEAIPLNDGVERTVSRDILYAVFSDRKGDTLHCFVNHWPSRYGGEMETINKRALTARVLRHRIDSLISLPRTVPKIIIMGDFNDTPDDDSIYKVLKAKSLNSLSKDDILVNLFTKSEDLGFEGTLKHQYRWQIFDQIIISSSLLYDENELHYIKGSAAIFHTDYLFVKDETYGGLKLYRTYSGPKYHGGFSDHLPVYMDLAK